MISEHVVLLEFKILISPHLKRKVKLGLFHNLFIKTHKKSSNANFSL